MTTEHQKGEMGTAQEMSGTMESSVRESPVDDRTYNLLQALTSKLEAIEAYEIYEQDDDNGLFSDLIKDERQHAERLLEELRRVLAG
jgi:rubrerythrin